MAGADTSFLGKGWAFPPSFDRTSRSVEMVSGVKDIDESLAVLFATELGTRIMRPSYGCPLRQFLFQVMDAATVTQLQSVIRTAVVNCEPRVTVNSISVDATGYMDGVLLVTLDYSVRGTNSRSNRVFPLYLQEGTQLSGH